MQFYMFQWHYIGNGWLHWCDITAYDLLEACKKFLNEHPEVDGGFNVTAK